MGKNTPRTKLSLLSAGLVVLAFVARAGLAQTAQVTAEPMLPPIEVIGIRLLPGLGIPLSDVAANVQFYGRQALARQHHATVADFLETNAPSVNINAAQGNPFQNDISFRGFTASPLLGTPQGISVFVDGVRINEPFGDVVNWDLLPQSAIARIQVIPGLSPLFGLNTLGGALAIYTRSGIDSPGGAFGVTGGSFGRRAAEFEWGGRHENLNYFVTANDYRDDGWADHNASRVRQFFGKLGWQDEQTDVSLSLNLADNRLQGTQTIPLSFFDNIRRAYTYPDININRLSALTLKGSHTVNDQVSFDANAYYRKYNNHNFSSNVNSNFGQIDPDSGAVVTAQAVNDQAAIDQDSYGAAAQLTLQGSLLGGKNQMVAGGSGDFGRARFTQQEQPAQFTADRGTMPAGEFAPLTDARMRNAYYGLFFADTWRFAPRWTLSAAGRYNLARLSIRDQSGNALQLNGDHAFARFAPALGLTFNPTAHLTAYATYNEGMRAPTPIELTCADPNAPCKLPNDFVADPPLKPVISKTFELGLRGKVNKDTQWSAAAYRTTLHDDIAFISSAGAATNAGFFSNVGQTRRQGVEFAMHTRLKRLAVAASYSYVDARFLTAFTEHSPNNSSADAKGDIRVRSGDRIPGIPQHTLKLALDYTVTPPWTVGASFLVRGAVFARGDENNQDRNGKVPGYMTVNLEMRYRVTKQFDIGVQINNLFDRRYANFGLLGENAFTGPDRTFGPAAGIPPVPEQFRAPGAPRGIWVSLRYHFGGKGEMPDGGG